MTTALLEATNNWSINKDNGLLNGVISIDLKKAFDTIDHDHEIVLRKLELQITELIRVLFDYSLPT